MGFFDFVDFIFNSEEYKDTGMAGERFTYRELKKRYDKNDILRNVYIKKENGSFTEIDIILVTRKGVFVIESKNYSGWISGDEKYKEWFQSLNRNTIYKFPNPVWQNAGHIKALKHTLKDFPDTEYYSIITFSNRCELKKIEVTSKNTYVLQREEISQLLRAIENDNKDSISNTDDILKILKPLERPDREVREEHIEQIKNDITKCPWCKSDLVERTNKKTGDKFFGCAAFPKCKYTTRELKEID